MKEKEITKKSEDLMALIHSKETKHDATIENMRIEIHHMLEQLDGSISQKMFYAVGLANDLSKTQEEFNVLCRRFRFTILGDIDLAIFEIKNQY